MPGLFAQWQPRYEEVGLVVFPAKSDDSKSPAVGNYLRAGLPAARAWAKKFGEANALGIACGKRNRLAVLDIDAPDENLLADAMNLFGSSPVVVQTASGKFHAWYRHNGEGRRLRIRELAGPVDVLGNGFAMAPPSLVAAGQYRFISGSLNDLGDLPAMRRPVAAGPLNALAISRAEPVQQGRRNEALWRFAMENAGHCQSLEDLIALSVTFNGAGLAAPLSTDELLRTVGSAWGKTQRGENWFGSTGGLTLARCEADSLLALGPDAFAVMAKLRLVNFGRVNFIVANAMAAAMPDGAWTVKRFALARAKLLTAGKIIEVRPASRANGPALYRFAENGPTGDRGAAGGGV